MPNVLSWATQVTPQDTPAEGRALNPPGCRACTSTLPWGKVASPGREQTPSALLSVVTPLPWLLPPPQGPAPPGPVPARRAHTKVRAAGPGAGALLRTRCRGRSGTVTHLSPNTQNTQSIDLTSLQTSEKQQLALGKRFGEEFCTCGEEFIKRLVLKQPP